MLYPLPCCVASHNSYNMASCYPCCSLFLHQEGEDDELEALLGDEEEGERAVDDLLGGSDDEEGGGGAGDGGLGGGEGGEEEGEGGASGFKALRARLKSGGGASGSGSEEPEVRCCIQHMLHPLALVQFQSTAFRSFSRLWGTFVCLPDLMPDLSMHWH